MLSKYVKCHYDKKLTALNDKVVIRKLEKYKERKFGNIVFPEMLQQPGQNLTEAVVESVGPDAKDSGLQEGMVVLIDHFAIYNLTDPVGVLDVENVICVLEK